MITRITLHTYVSIRDTKYDMYLWDCCRKASVIHRRDLIECVVTPRLHVMYAYVCIRVVLTSVVHA